MIEILNKEFLPHIGMQFSGKNRNKNRTEKIILLGLHGQ